MELTIDGRVFECDPLVGIKLPDDADVEWAVRAYADGTTLRDVASDWGDGVCHADKYAVSVGVPFIHTDGCAYAAVELYHGGGRV